MHATIIVLSEVKTVVLPIPSIGIKNNVWFILLVYFLKPTPAKNSNLKIVLCENKNVKAHSPTTSRNPSRLKSESNFAIFLIPYRLHVAAIRASFGRIPYVEMASSANSVISRELCNS